MVEKVFKVSVRTDMKNKAGEVDRKKTGNSWANSELSLIELIDHIKGGYPITHQFTGGRRNKANFLKTNALIADIDGGLSVDDALRDEFIKNNASFIYTTPSHTEELNRFRIIFRLPNVVHDWERYEALYAALRRRIPTDPKAGSCTQFFFGNSRAECHVINGVMATKLQAQMEREGLQLIHHPKHKSLSADRLTSDTPVTVKNRGVMMLGELEAGASIRCPFGTHLDGNPSAFVKVNKEGVRGVECRSCGHSAWSETPHKRDSGFNYFDDLVIGNRGTSNAHFEYIGLTKFDHELEPSMGKSNYHVFNSERVEDIPILPGVNLIKSPKGTGKTHALSKLVSLLKDPKIRKQNGLQSDQRIIFVGHRQSLISESASKLGLDCYLDTAETDTMSRGVGSGTLKPPYYAICLDSLASRVRLNEEKYGVVIIDESEQVFSHFLSDHMRRPERNFEVLANIMKQSRFIYCLDADIGTITLTGILACLGWRKGEEHRRVGKELKQLYCFLNEYTPPKRDLLLYASKQALLNDLRANISKGKKCFVVSNSRKFANEQYALFSKAYVDRKFRVVASDSGDDEDKKAFLRDIKTEVLNYDAVFASPSIGTGVDITFPGNESKIDCVYGFFQGGVNTHFDMDQQLGRVRHPGEVKVWVNPKSSRFSTDRKRVLRELLSDEHIEGLRYYLDQHGAHYNFDSDPFVELLTEVIVCRRRSMNDLKRNFVSLKKSTGWNVVDVVSTNREIKAGSIVERASKVQYRDQKVSRILGADPIDHDTALEIMKSKEKNLPLTDAQKASSERYWMEWFYGQEISEELILLDNDGRFRGQISLLEVVIDPTMRLLSFSDLRENMGLLVSYRGSVEKKLLEKVVFLREALSKAGLFDGGAFSLRLDVDYSATDLSDFAVFMKANEERFQRLFGREVYKDIHTRPLAQIRMLLGIIGLKQECVKRNRGGNPATYRISRSEFDGLSKIMERRRARAASREQIQESGG